MAAKPSLTSSRVKVRDERVEVEPAVHVQVEDERHVLVRAARAVEAAGDDFLLPRQVGCGQIGGHALRREADGDDQAAAAHGGIGLSDDARRAGRVVAQSAPRPSVSSRASAATSSVRGSTACVAPRARAVSRLKATGSAATMRARASLQPRTEESPTPPAP